MEKLKFALDFWLEYFRNQYPNSTVTATPVKIAVDVRVNRPTNYGLNVWNRFYIFQKLGNSQYKDMDITIYETVFTDSQYAVDCINVSKIYEKNIYQFNWLEIEGPDGIDDVMQMLFAGYEISIT